VTDRPRTVWSVTSPRLTTTTVTARGGLGHRCRAGTHHGQIGSRRVSAVTNDSAERQFVEGAAAQARVHSKAESGRRAGLRMTHS